MMSHARAATANDDAMSKPNKSRGDEDRGEHSKADPKSENSNSNGRTGMTHTTAETVTNMTKYSKAVTKQTFFDLWWFAHMRAARLQAHAA